MKFLSKTGRKGQNITSKPPRMEKPGNLYAICRRLASRVSHLEEEVSTLRRDINATRRKVYREEANSPLSITELTKVEQQRREAAIVNQPQTGDPYILGGEQWQRIVQNQQ